MTGKPTMKKVNGPTTAIRVDTKMHADKLLSSDIGFLTLIRTALNDAPISLEYTTQKAALPNANKGGAKKREDRRGAGTVTVHDVVISASTVQHRDFAVTVLTEALKNIKEHEKKALKSVCRNPKQYSEKTKLYLDENVFQMIIDTVRSFSEKPLEPTLSATLKTDADTTAIFYKEAKSLLQQLKDAKSKKAIDVLDTINKTYAKCTEDMDQPVTIALGKIVLEIEEKITAFDEKQAFLHLEAKKRFTDEQKAAFSNELDTAIKAKKQDLTEDQRQIALHSIFKMVSDAQITTDYANSIVAVKKSQAFPDKASAAKPGDFLVGISTPKMTVYARTTNQNILIQALQNDAYPIVINSGPAGTGKTFTSAAYAVSESPISIKPGAPSRDLKYKKAVIIRPVVEAGEQLGFMPGTLEEKMKPYLQPLIENIQDMTGLNFEEQMKRFQVLEIGALAFMRGRTFKDSVVILDEAQNATFAQLVLLLTRLGPGSKLIINGDPTQTDLPIAQRNGKPFANVNQMPGLPLFLEIAKQHSQTKICLFDESDIVRHAAVKEYVPLIEAFRANFNSERAQEVLQSHLQPA